MLLYGGKAREVAKQIYRNNNRKFRKISEKKIQQNKTKKTPKPKTNQTTKPAIVWSLIREGHGVLKNKSMSWVWAGQVPGNRNLKNKTPAHRVNENLSLTTQQNGFCL